MKSSRDLERLLGQVEKFTSIIEENPDVFERLVGILSRSAKEWKSGRIQRMIIWPCSPSGKTRADTGKRIEKVRDLTVIEYRGEDYQFFG